MKGIQLDPDVDLDAIADQMEGYSGSDITNICRDAAFMPMRRRLAERTTIDYSQISQSEFDIPISMEHFQTVLKNVKPSVSPADILRYEQWDKQYKSS